MILLDRLCADETIGKTMKMKPDSMIPLRVHDDVPTTLHGFIPIERWLFPRRRQHRLHARTEQCAEGIY